STTSASAAKAAEARQSASGAPASRVMTTSDKASGGSRSDIASDGMARQRFLPTILALAPRKVPEGAAHSTSKPARKPPAVFALATQSPTRHHAPTMQRVLIIRSSSLGDIVHALPVVHDMR